MSTHTADDVTLRRLETDEELRNRLFELLPGWGALASELSEAHGTSLDSIAYVLKTERMEVDR